MAQQDAQREIINWNGEDIDVTEIDQDAHIPDWSQITDTLRINNWMYIAHQPHYYIEVRFWPIPWLKRAMRPGETDTYYARNTCVFEYVDINCDLLHLDVPIN